MKPARTLALLAVLAAFGIVLSGCGPTAEEQAGADRMQKGIESSRNAQGSRPAGAATGAPR